MVGDVLTNPGGKDEGVETAKSRRQHAGMQSDTIDKIIDRKDRAGLPARLQVTHVVADA